jgi:hypothetical protein
MNNDMVMMMMMMMVCMMVMMMMINISKLYNYNVQTTIYLFNCL